MPDTSPPLSRTVAWILLVLLIGISALYYWRETTLSQSVSKQSLQIKDTTQSLASAQASAQDLRAKMDAAQLAHQAKVKDLSDSLDAARQDGERLNAEIAALKTEHEEALATLNTKQEQALAALNTMQEKALADEQEQARTALAVVEEKLAAANEENSRLAAEVEQLQQSMTQAQAEHESKTKELEAGLIARIAHYRTALEGADPERAAQIESLEKQVKEAQQALATEQQGAQTVEAEYQRRLTESSASNVDLQGKLNALEAQLSAAETALEGLRAEHAAALEQHAAAIAEAETGTRAAREELGRFKEDSSAAMQAAVSEHTTRVNEANTRIAGLEKDLADTQATLAALREQNEAEVADLSTKIADSEQAVAKLQGELADAQQNAAAAKESYDQQIEAAREQLAELEENHKREQQQALESHANEVSGLKTRIEQAQRATKLVGVFSGKGGRLSDTGMVVDLSGSEVQFSGGKAELPGGELPTLDRIAASLNEEPALRVRIEGYTDSDGDEEPNLELSRQRAAAVMQALVERGVAAERMSAVGFGEANPIASNDTWEGRRQNRRVEVHILD